MNIKSKNWARIGLVALLTSVGACEKILEVEAPGRIADEDLNNLDAFPALVVGMSYNLSDAMDEVLQFSALASGELWHGGSYDWADIPRGIILPEDVNGEWADMQQARWVAEHGIVRMSELYEEGAFNSSPLVARAYLLAGFSNRMLGEMLCETAIDGGPKEPHTVHFDRALGQFTNAIEIGEAAGTEDIVTAAYAGRASIKAWMGDWAGAALDAAQVPADFEYMAILQTPEPSNDLQYETYDRPEYTVYNTLFAEHPDDPRAEWRVVYEDDGSVATSANGATPFYQQQKYTDAGSDIPLTKGTEMLVLRAEAALRNSDIPGAFLLLNEARDFYGMEPLATPATLEEAWDTLHYERSATVWLENRHLWDARRWFAEGESSPAYYSFLEGRDQCVPISEEEVDSNDNF